MKQVIDCKSTFITAPPAKGKTLIAIPCLIMALSKNGIGVYLVPQVMLLHQKAKLLREFFKDTIKIVIMQGEIRPEYLELKDAMGKTIIVTTYESFRSFLFEVQKREYFNTKRVFKGVVIDEAQMLGDKSRGSSLETMLFKLKEEHGSQFCFLSGSFGKESAEKWSKKFNSILIRDLSKRTFKFTIIPKIHTGDSGTTKKLRSKKFNERNDLVIQECKNFVTKYISKSTKTLTTAKMLIFIYSRKSAEILALRAQKELGELLPEYINQIFCNFIHAGLDLEDRKEIFNNYMNEDGIRLLFCSPVLEAGVDIKNIQTILIADAERENYSKIQLSQMIGRSREKIGEIIFLIAQSQIKDFKKSMIGLDEERGVMKGFYLEPLKSQISIQNIPKLILELLFRRQINFEKLKQKLKAILPEPIDDNNQAYIKATLHHLITLGYVTSNKNMLGLTYIGAAIVETQLDLETAAEFLEFIAKHPEPMPWECRKLISRTVAMALSAESPLLYNEYQDPDKVMKEKQEKIMELLDNYRWDLKTVKNSQYAEKFYEGDLETYRRKCIWYAAAYALLYYGVRSNEHVEKEKKQLVPSSKHYFEIDLSPVNEQYTKTFDRLDRLYKRFQKTREETISRKPALRRHGVNYKNKPESYLDKELLFDLYCIGIKGISLRNLHSKLDSRTFFEPLLPYIPLLFQLKIPRKYVKVSIDQVDTCLKSKIVNKIDWYKVRDTSRKTRFLYFLKRPETPQSLTKFDNEVLRELKSAPKNEATILQLYERLKKRAEFEEMFPIVPIFFQLKQPLDSNTISILKINDSLRNKLVKEVDYDIKYRPSKLPYFVYRIKSATKPVEGRKKCRSFKFADFQTYSNKPKCPLCDQINTIKIPVHNSMSICNNCGTRVFRDERGNFRGKLGSKIPDTLIKIDKKGLQSVRKKNKKYEIKVRKGHELRMEWLPKSRTYTFYVSNARVKRFAEAVGHISMLGGTMSEAARQAVQQYEIKVDTYSEEKIKEDQKKELIGQALRDKIKAQRARGRLIPIGRAMVFTKIISNVIYTRKLVKILKRQKTRMKEEPEDLVYRELDRIVHTYSFYDPSEPLVIRNRYRVMDLMNRFRSAEGIAENFAWVAEKKALPWKYQFASRQENRYVQTDLYHGAKALDRYNAGLNYLYFLLQQHAENALADAGFTRSYPGPGIIHCREKKVIKKTTQTKRGRSKSKNKAFYHAMTKKNKELTFDFMDTYRSVFRFYYGELLRKKEFFVAEDFFSGTDEVKRKIFYVSPQGKDKLEALFKHICSLEFYYRTKKMSLQVIMEHEARNLAQYLNSKENVPYVPFCAFESLREARWVSQRVHLIDAVMGDGKFLQLIELKEEEVSKKRSMLERNIQDLPKNICIVDHTDRDGFLSAINLVFKHLLNRNITIFPASDRLGRNHIETVLEDKVTKVVKRGMRNIIYIADFPFYTHCKELLENLYLQFRAENQHVEIYWYDHHTITNLEKTEAFFQAHNGNFYHETKKHTFEIIKGQTISELAAVIEPFEKWFNKIHIESFITTYCKGLDLETFKNGSRAKIANIFKKLFATFKVDNSCTDLDWFDPFFIIDMKSMFKFIIDMRSILALLKNYESLMPPLSSAEIYEIVKEKVEFEVLDGIKKFEDRFHKINEASYTEPLFKRFNYYLFKSRYRIYLPVFFKNICNLKNFEESDEFNEYLGQEKLLLEHPDKFLYYHKFGTTAAHITYGMFIYKKDCPEEWTESLIQKLKNDTSNLDFKLYIWKDFTISMRAMLSRVNFHGLVGHEKGHMGSVGLYLPMHVTRLKNEGAHYSYSFNFYSYVTLDEFFARLILSKLTTKSEVFSEIYYEIPDLSSNSDNTLFFTIKNKFNFPTFIDAVDTLLQSPFITKKSGPRKNGFLCGTVNLLFSHKRDEKYLNDFVNYLMLSAHQKNGLNSPKVICIDEIAPPSFQNLAVLMAGRVGFGAENIPSILFAAIEDKATFDEAINNLDRIIHWCNAKLVVIKSFFSVLWQLYADNDVRGRAGRSIAGSQTLLKLQKIAKTTGVIIFLTYTENRNDIYVDKIPHLPTTVRELLDAELFLEKSEVNPFKRSEGNYFKIHITSDDFIGGTTCNIKIREKKAPRPVLTDISQPEVFMRTNMVDMEHLKKEFPQLEYCMEGVNKFGIKYAIIKFNKDIDFRDAEAIGDKVNKNGSLDIFLWHNGNFSICNRDAMHIKLSLLEEYGGVLRGDQGIFFGQAAFSTHFSSFEAFFIQFLNLDLEIPIREFSESLRVLKNVTGTFFATFLQQSSGDMQKIYLVNSIKGIRNRIDNMEANLCQKKGIYKIDRKKLRNYLLNFFKLSNFKRSGIRARWFELLVQLLQYFSPPEAQRFLQFLMHDLKGQPKLPDPQVLREIITKAINNTLIWLFFDKIKKEKVIILSQIPNFLDTITVAEFKNKIDQALTENRIKGTFVDSKFNIHSNIEDFIRQLQASLHIEPVQFEEIRLEYEYAEVIAAPQQIKKEVLKIRTKNIQKAGTVEKELNEEIIDVYDSRIEYVKRVKSEYSNYYLLFKFKKYISEEDLAIVYEKISAASSIDVRLWADGNVTFFNREPAYISLSFINLILLKGSAEYSGGDKLFIRKEQYLEFFDSFEDFFTKFLSINLPSPVMGFEGTIALLKEYSRVFFEDTKLRKPREKINDTKKRALINELIEFFTDFKLYNVEESSWSDIEPNWADILTRLLSYFGFDAALAKKDEILDNLREIKTETEPNAAEIEEQITKAFE